MLSVAPHRYSAAVGIGQSPPALLQGMGGVGGTFLSATGEMNMSDFTASSGRVVFCGIAPRFCTPFFATRTFGDGEYLVGYPLAVFRIAPSKMGGKNRVGVLMRNFG